MYYCIQTNVKNIMNRGTVSKTGASRGIGKALSLKYVEEGKNVIDVSRSSFAMSPDEGSDRLIGVNADITTTEGRRDVRAIAEKTGGVNVLIHNAGMLVHKPFNEITGDELR